VVPFIQLWTGPFRKPLMALLTPTLVIAPAALIALVFKGIDDVAKDVLNSSLFTRPAEVVETFQYLYMLFYVIVLRRRLRALDEAGVTHVGLQSEDRAA
jgi:hypothetical protein